MRPKPNTGTQSFARSPDPGGDRCRGWGAGRRAALFVLAVTASAAGVLGCGSDEETVLIPQQDATYLVGQLEEVNRRVSSGACEDVTRGTLVRLEKRVEALPENLDPNVRDALGESIDELSGMVETNCEEPTETAPVPETTTPTEPQQTTPTEETEPDEKTNTDESGGESPDEGGGGGGGGGDNGDGGDGNQGGGGGGGNRGGGGNGGAPSGGLRPGSAPGTARTPPGADPQPPSRPGPGDGRTQADEGRSGPPAAEEPAGTETSR